MQLSAVVFGDEEARRRLNAQAERAQNLTGAWNMLLPQLRAEEKVIFASHGHGTWPANRPGTIRQKGHAQPMVDSGRLRAALTMPGARGSRTRRGKTQMVFGVNDTTIFWSRFVGKRRPFMVDTKTAERLGTRAVLHHLVYGTGL